MSNLNVSEKVLGTNCYNCKYVSAKKDNLDTGELNDEGGIDPKNSDELERAKQADLITLPGGTKYDTQNKAYCNHQKVKMYVTARMCCAFWDNPNVKRPWKQAQTLTSTQQ